MSFRRQGRRKLCGKTLFILFSCALVLVLYITFYVESILGRGNRGVQSKTNREWSAVHHDLMEFMYGGGGGGGNDVVRKHVPVQQNIKHDPLASSVPVVDSKEQDSLSSVSSSATSDTMVRTATSTSTLPFRAWNDPKLPRWLEDYLAWHTQQREELTPDNWHTKQYLVQRCLMVDAVCAGLADRLGSLPNTVRFAYDAKRIFFLNWEKPAPLEDFFLPPSSSSSPKDGRPVLDWRLPDWLKEKMQLASLRVIRTHRDGEQAITNSTATVVAVRQMHTFDYYQDVLTRQREMGDIPEEGSPHEVVRGLWHCMFQPTPPVLQRIHQAMAELNVTPAQYISVHIRALYKMEDLSKHPMHVNKAVDVASKRIASSQTSNTNIVVVSDSLVATREAVNYGNTKYKELGITTVGRISEQDDTPKLHLDRGRTFLKIRTKDAEDRPSSDFYDAFVDLYLLGHSQCVVHGVGGYGQLGALLAHNVACESTSYIKQK